MNTFTVGLWNFQPYCDMTTQTSTPNYSHWFDCWLFRIQNNQIQMKYFHLDSEAFNKKGFGNFPNLPTPQSLEFVSSIPKHILQMCCTVCSVQSVLPICQYANPPPPKEQKINQSTLSPSSSPPATSPSTLPPPLSPSSSPLQFLPSS